jgi:hypothetical protein
MEMQPGVHAMISRRALLGASASSLLPSLARANAAGARFGAIRWDAWYDNASPAPGAYTQAALGPSEYHTRAPWFASAPGAHSITINGNQAAVMTAEIAYAKNAGIKYWGYVWYDLTSPMMNAWDLHQASATKTDVNWCMVIGYNQFVLDTAAGSATLVSYFQQANYEKVLGGRPPVYMWRDNGPPNGTAATRMTALRAACVTAGVGDPYVVCMHGYPPYAEADRIAIGGDAISAYYYSGTKELNGTYPALAAQVEAWWPTMAATGSPFVPLAMMGSNRRPRIDRPMYWEVSTQTPRAGFDVYYEVATPAELASHLSALVSWMVANPASVPAGAALIYAWNEFDEGGWLCPTWTADGPDTTRLNAVGPIIL